MNRARRDGEPVITADLIRTMLAAQHPDLSGLPLMGTDDPHGSAGFTRAWDNTMVRLGTDLALRLPRDGGLPAAGRAAGRETCRDEYDRLGPPSGTGEDRRATGDDHRWIRARGWALYFGLVFAQQPPDEPLHADGWRVLENLSSARGLMPHQKISWSIRTGTRPKFRHESTN